MAGFQIRSRDLVSPSARAEIHATDVDILTAGANGVGVVSGCDVTAQGSPDMTLAVAAGVIRIASGAWKAVAAGNVTIGTADATNPRIDLVSADNTGAKVVTPGTAAASAKPPGLPAGNVALAYAYVAATDTAISSGEIDDKRFILPTGLVLYGTAFPTTGLVDNMQVHRTDVDLLCFYDLANTRWLTLTRYRLELGTFNNISTTGTQTNGIPTEQVSGYDMLVETFGANLLVLTTNDGTKYWTTKVIYKTVPNTDNNLTSATFNTSADTATTHTHHSAALNAVLSSTAKSLIVQADKTSTAGALYGGFFLTYRLVVV